MTIWDLPGPGLWDARKFATRYGLNSLAGDFYVNGEGKLVVRPTLPDNPPIFEAPDSPLISLRNLAVALADDPIPQSKLLRGALLALVDELNLHALKINSILDAVDAATSLADLKARIGAIADYPQRTLAQAKASIRNHITAGDVDQ